MLRARFLIPVFVAILTAPALAPSTVAAEETFIQPGASFEGYCTMNFVFTDADGTLYVGTAAHCVNNGIGQRIGHNGDTWGTVVLDLDLPDADFALVRVDPDHHANVNPAMRGWGGPTGVAKTSDTTTGDRLSLHGYGDVIGWFDATRSRTGVLVGHTSTFYTMDAPAVWGDSGGPITHQETGLALGIVSGFNVPFSTDRGPTVEHILKRAAAEGYPISLMTGTLDEPIL